MGNWSGNIELGTIRLPLEFHFYLDSAKNLTGKWDSPKQNAKDLPFSKIGFSDDSLKVEMAAIGGSYAGRFIANDSITGSWLQGGKILPLNFKRTSVNSAFQEIRSLYPDEKEIVISPAGSSPLSGTLLSKNNQQKIAVIIAGSGPTDRNGNNPFGLNTNAYQMLAHALDSQNIASFRFDKRGIGKSAAAGFKEGDLVFEDYIRDAETIINFLHDSLGFKNVYLVGHSEGSLIGMVAARHTKVSGFISVAGAGRPIDVVIEEQLSALPDSVKKDFTYIISELKKGKEVDEKLIQPSLMPLFRKSVQPYMISWMKYAPATEIKNVKCPVLIIQGSCDAQVKEADAEKLHDASKKSQLSIIPLMTHTLKDAGKNCEQQQTTYSDPTLPLNPLLTETITNFIKTN